MFRLTELDELVKEHGKNGLRLLMLFRLLRSKVSLVLRESYPTLTFSEADLNQICLSRAYKLLKLKKMNPQRKALENFWQGSKHRFKGSNDGDSLVAAPWRRE